MDGRSTIVLRRGAQDDAFSFDVAIGDFQYKASVNEDYWQSLTGGKITPEELVRRSFAFLLEREGAESILREFDLTAIGRYFPEYEETIHLQVMGV